MEQTAREKKPIPSAVVSLWSLRSENDGEKKKTPSLKHSVHPESSRLDETEKACVKEQVWPWCWIWGVGLLGSWHQGGWDVVGTRSLELRRVQRVALIGCFIRNMDLPLFLIRWEATRSQHPCGKVRHRRVLVWCGVDSQDSCEKSMCCMLRAKHWHVLRLLTSLLRCDTLLWEVFLLTHGACEGQGRHAQQSLQNNSSVSRCNGKRREQK